MTVCNLNQFRLSVLKDIEEIDEILRKYSDEKRNKSDGSNFENKVDRQRKAAKNELNDDIDDDEENRISDDDISIDEATIIEELVAIAVAEYTVDDLSSAGHQFHKMILSCSWKGFDCMSGLVTLKSEKLI